MKLSTVACIGFLHVINFAHTCKKGLELRDKVKKLTRSRSLLARLLFLTLRLLLLRLARHVCKYDVFLRKLKYDYEITHNITILLFRTRFRTNILETILR